MRIGPHVAVLGLVPAVGMARQQAGNVLLGCPDVVSNHIAATPGTNTCVLRAAGAT